MRKLLLFFTLWANVCAAQIKTYSEQVLTQATFDAQIKHAMDSLNVPGLSVAVINHGRVVYAKGYGFADLQQRKAVKRETYFEAASLSKPVFSYYVLKLAHQGVINLDTPLYTYLPVSDIEDERYKKITARMVLSHTTGLPNWRETEKMKLSFDPGTQFSYSGEGYVYLAKVIAHLKNILLRDLDHDFQREVTIPFQLKNFHFIQTSEAKAHTARGYKDGKVVQDERDRQSFDPAGGMYANAPTYASFLVQLMEQKSDFEEIFKPVIYLRLNDVLRNYFGIDAWTLGLAMIKVNNSIRYWHGGNNLGYTSSFMIDPDKKFGYVYFMNADQCNSMKKVMEALLWR